MPNLIPAFLKRFAGGCFAKPEVTFFLVGNRAGAARQFRLYAKTLAAAIDESKVYSGCTDRFIVETLVKPDIINVTRLENTPSKWACDQYET